MLLDLLVFNHLVALHHILVLLPLELYGGQIDLVWCLICKILVYLSIYYIIVLYMFSIANEVNVGTLHDLILVLATKLRN